jgi:cbb3-type cytochrome oxidase subunit 3
MKLLLTLFLVFSSIFSSAQINKDSYLNILAGLRDTVFQVYALENTPQLVSHKSNIKLSHEKKLEEVRSNFEKEIKDSQNRIRNIFFFLLEIFSIAIIVFWFYFSKKEKVNTAEREKLHYQIDSLKKKLAVQSVATPVSSKKSLSLSKERIEKAINNRLGESSWMILIIIFNNPSISNKEIAEKVSLSVEGVSSSLRRMYQAFEINSSSNKKITLIMKATRLSFED